MKLMIDTNVILDILIKREPFYSDSMLTALNMEENNDYSMISISAVTDIYYIANKYLGDAEARESIRNIQEVFFLVEVLPEDFEKAMGSKMPDLEDALVAAIAKRKKADYIITRNKKDFERSKVPAITPKEFVDMISIAT